MEKVEKSIVNTGIYSNNFSEAFSNILKKSGVTGYKLHQFTKLDEGYLSRLRSGEKHNPTPETIVKISLGLVHFNDKLRISDIENLFKSVGRSLNPDNTRAI